MPNPIDSIYADGTLYDIQPSEAAYSGRSLQSVYQAEVSELLHTADHPYQMWKHNIAIKFSGAPDMGALFFTLPYWKSGAFSRIEHVIQVLNNVDYTDKWPIVSWYNGMGMSWPVLHVLANGGGFYSGVNVQYCAVAGEYYWHGWDPKSNIYVYIHATGSAPYPYGYTYDGWQGLNYVGASLVDIVTA